MKAKIDEVIKVTSIKTIWLVSSPTILNVHKVVIVGLYRIIIPYSNSENDSLFIAPK